MNKEVILTGIRSNDEPTLGNYLGAFLPMVELQKKHAGQFQLNMFVPDLHSFTTPIEHGSLYENTIKNLKYFVTAGLDVNNEDTFIYRQSYIPAHSELTWILDCFSYFGELSRMTQFKEKSEKEMMDAGSGDFTSPTSQKGVPDYTHFQSEIKQKIERSVTVGLFNYPVLMAADILLYGAKWVPVGEDQRQHVEFTRDLAIRINNKFGEVFVVPEDNAKQAAFVGRGEPVRVRSLRTPEKKMSKSITDPAGTILLSDNPVDAAQKVMSATTDSENSINYNWQKQPGVTNLLQILALLSEKSQQEVNDQWQGKTSYGELKEAVAEAVKNFLTGFQDKFAGVNQDQLIQKLEADEAAMNTAANTTLERVQLAVGLRPKNGPSA
jgi:tryptophanyl-tRNA synthetase